MMKVVEKVKLTAVNVRDAAIKKVVPVAVSASTALAAATVPVFAAEGTPTSTDGVKAKLVEGFTGIVNNCVDIAITIVPIGLGLMAVGKMWDVAKRFFTKTTSG